MSCWRCDSEKSNVPTKGMTCVDLETNMFDDSWESGYFCDKCKAEFLKWWNAVDKEQVVDTNAQLHLVFARHRLERLVDAMNEISMKHFLPTLITHISEEAPIYAMMKRLTRKGRCDTFTA